MKYAFIDAEKAHYPVAHMCDWLGVSRSGFYEWCRRPPSATELARRELKIIIEHLFWKSDGTYGHRRIHAELARLGRPAGLEHVRRLMRELELVPCQPRPWRPVTTIAGAAAGVPDLVGRDFTAEAPGVKLVGDITYIRTWQGWLYLATVIDCHTKGCIGYAMADHLRTELVTAASDMAARNYRLAENAIFHSDRGTQYMSEEFARYTTRRGIRRSVGRTGVCYDNALAESFNAALKVERVNRTVYPTREHARKDVTRYIEFHYNTKRLHSALGYRIPQETYNDYLTNQTAA
jgi:putative transposase